MISYITSKSYIF